MPLCFTHSTSFFSLSEDQILLIPGLHKENNDCQHFSGLHTSPPYQSHQDVFRQQNLLDSIPCHWLLWSQDHTGKPNCYSYDQVSDRQEIILEMRRTRTARHNSTGVHTGYSGVHCRYSPVKSGYSENLSVFFFFLLQKTPTARFYYPTGQAETQFPKPSLESNSHVAAVLNLFISFFLQRL